MDQATDYGVVLVTASSKAEAMAIAQTLVQEKLAACVNCLPVESIYTWEGALHQEQEWQLLIKTRLEHYPLLETRIRELHSYEVPEIIAIPLHQGSAPYLRWIADNTRHL